MGQKVKGGLWCPSCKAPRMGVKNRHRIRNSMSAVVFPVTGGLSAYGAKSEPYVCTTCGTRLVRLKQKQPDLLMDYVLKPLWSAARSALDRRRAQSPP